MWVRSEYTSELAVVCAWIAVLVPWNVTYFNRSWEDFGVDLESSIFLLRFPFFELQVRSESVIREHDGTPIEFDISNFEAMTYPGTELVGSIYVTSPAGAISFYDSTLETASILWLLASAAFAIAFLLSLALYAREDAVTDALPVSQVRVMGALLGIGALATAGSTTLYYLERDVVGTPIPVGVLLVGALAVILLRTEAVPATDDEELPGAGDEEDELAS